MKCIVCHKYFPAQRSHAQYCSAACKMRASRSRKNEEKLFEEEQQVALGKAQEKQQQKVSDIDQKISPLKTKINGFKKAFNRLKELKQIALVELKSVQESMKEKEQQIECLSDALTMDEGRFYELYCKDVDVRANDLGFILNGVINLSLIPFNEDERKKEIQRVMEKMGLELINITEGLEEDDLLADELRQKVLSIQQKLKQQQQLIQTHTEKIKVLEKQKAIPIKVALPEKNILSRHSMSSKNDANFKNGVSGTDLQHMVFNTFRLEGELGRFLGELDRNRTAFALTGDSGAGKSYFSFELAKVFIDAGFSAKYFALEEGLGKLTQNKVRFYDLGNGITITGTATLKDVRRDAKLFDLIVIDSFQKLNVKAEEFERLRQDFPKTIFIIIFQKTSSGSMRGGSSIKFNSSATIDVQFKDEERIAVMEKGRYGTIGWVYSIDEGRVVSGI